MNNISLRQLEIFAAVYREGTITGAARRVGLSQAAASQALAELEDQLQRRLFDRHGRRITLNAAGRELFPRAVDVLDRVEAMERERKPADLRLYASLTVGNYMLPQWIARFWRKRPGSRFQVTLGNTDRVVESVRQFESDAGWIEGSARHPDLLAYAWREDALVIVAPPKHALAGRRATQTQLAAQRWVLRERGSGTREVFEGAIAGKFRVEDVPLEFGGIGAVKRAVMAGAGLTCISRSAVEPELKAGQLKMVHTPWLNLRRQITVLVHRQKYIDSGLREFLHYCGVNVASTSGGTVSPAE